MSIRSNAYTIWSLFSSGNLLGEGLARIATIDGTTKNVLCQEKSGLGEGQGFLIFVSTSDSTMRASNFRIIFAKISQSWQMNYFVLKKYLATTNIGDAGMFGKQPIKEETAKCCGYILQISCLGKKEYRPRDTITSWQEGRLTGENQPAPIWLKSL